MSVNISRQDVEHVADLARLQLSREEQERLSGELSHILTYMEELNVVETAGIQTTTSVAVNHAGMWREDDVRPSLSPDQALSNAPEAVDGLFHVPPIIRDR